MTVRRTFAESSHSGIIVTGTVQKLSSNKAGDCCVMKAQDRKSKSACDN